MNFLAHIYLSNGINHLMLGNFMADSIKGKKYLDYPDEISKGIQLHRFIDNFTDTHPIVLNTKIMLRPHFGRYSPLVSDIVYDHFLALNFEQITGLELEAYVIEVYAYMHQNEADMTDFAKGILPYMSKHNWLLNYNHKEGLQKIFNQFGRRIGVEELFDNVTDVVWEDYSKYESDFYSFWKELEVAVNEKLNTLNG